MSVQRLEEHRRLWEAKPVLRDVYAVWFDVLLEGLPARARVLELGAGPGFLSRHVRARRPDLRWIGTDILAVPWNDLAADGLRMPFRDAAVDAVVGLDFIHHLARPARFFGEAARVLAPGGTLRVVEPWVTPFSFPVYRWLHQEGCRPRLDPWNPFGLGDEKDAFEGDAAVVWRLLRDTSPARWGELGLAPPGWRVLNGFAYLASLGFRPHALVPRSLARALIGLDRAAGALAPVMGMRAVVSWQRAGAAATAARA